MSQNEDESIDVVYIIYCNNKSGFMLTHTLKDMLRCIHKERGEIDR